MGWSGSRTVMPIFAISSTTIRLASLIRTIPNREGSEPRKKLRHTGISGAIARSW